MVRIWAKVMVKEKIKKDCMYELPEKFSIVHFLDYVQEICYKLDIPNPVMLKYHIKNFFEFNNVRFRPDDFVESVNFDELVLENAPL